MKSNFITITLFCEKVQRMHEHTCTESVYFLPRPIKH
jgi:hypothetical protein